MLLILSGKKRVNALSYPGRLSRFTGVTGTFVFSTNQMLVHVAAGGIGISGPNSFENASVRTDGIRIIVD
jgi:hypothetical protein